ncbi:hypothetical protein ACHAWF_013430 [Thalassiosira exigua]
MAYKITLSLGRIDDDCVRYASSPEDAAAVAWRTCAEFGLDMPNRSWQMKTWDAWEGRYETTPVTDHMIRGNAGKYPKKVEFMHTVIDMLTENRHDPVGASIMAMAKLPHTEEPGGSSKPKFETFRGRDRLVVEFDEDAEWSAVDDIGQKLDDAISKAKEEGEAEELANLLEEKLNEIKGCKKHKKLDTVE